MKTSKESSHHTRPYLILPVIVEQPTWGGDYILNFKKWSHLPQYQNKKIGQSYELCGDSIFAECRHSALLSDHLVKTHSHHSLKTLIQEDPKKILGLKTIQKYGHLMPILIKFTQAKGNSFQLHASKKTGRWDIKPETWYYFEPGLMTFGIKDLGKIKRYQTVCHTIYDYMNELSRKVKAGFLTVSAAEVKAKSFIEQEHPISFVNVHHTKAGEIIDLSAGSLHHSWEEENTQLPLGNIVYEIQLDKADDEVTIRSFDQGKIKSDGSIRQIHIDDYFYHINKEPQKNLISSVQSNAALLQNNKQATIKSIVKNQYYRMDELELKGTVSNEYTQTNDTFHHLFVKQGTVEIISDPVTLTIEQGHSAFIPAAVESYELRNISAKNSIVIKSYI